MSQRQDLNCNESEHGRQPAECVMQKTGEVIIPQVSVESVISVAKELYGLQVVSCEQLNGYDDKNYRLQVSPITSNPHIGTTFPSGYVLKVINSMDTNRPDIHLFSDAQNAFMNHLRYHGINTQEPVPTRDGELLAFYTFPSLDGTSERRRYAVCLRTYIPGQILYDVTVTPDLCYKLGEFLGSMHKALQDFDHRFYDNFDCLWSLNNIPKVKDFVYVITDPSDRRIVDDIITEFSSSVLTMRHELRTAIIHGDPNEQNILVLPTESEPMDTLRRQDGCNYVISGILDFQDVARSHPLYDLALLIAYVTIITETFDLLDAGGHILSGYKSKVELPEVERSLVRISVAARLVQSLVFGAYSHSLDPTNTYVLTTSKRGWKALHAFWNTPADILDKRWMLIEASYKN